MVMVMIIARYVMVWTAGIALSLTALTFRVIMSDVHLYSLPSLALVSASQGPNLLCKNLFGHYHYHHGNTGVAQWLQFVCFVRWLFP